MAFPALTVRTYPAFRPARLYRVFVSNDSLYFIRLGGLISPSDAGSGRSLDPGERAVSALIRKFAGKSLAAELSRIQNSDPDSLVASSKKHYKIAAGEVVDSRLDPPSLFSGQRPSFARWKLAAQGRKSATYEIEDQQSLETALKLLPPLLGDKLTVKVGNR